MRKYPVDVQTFETIIKGNYAYVDKTDIVYDLVHRFQYVFLSRPRRFGKTLLTTTLESYFSGEKALFKGLKIGEKEQEWNVYPVLHFAFNGVSVNEIKDFTDNLNVQLGRYEKKYGLSQDELSFSARLTNIIDTAYSLENQKVVVLVDEYDKPLLDAIGNETLSGEIRPIMRNFFSPLKEREKKLRFVFLTGITKFSQLSIFSELNTLQNISMWPEYASICGITKEEILTVLSKDVDSLAERNGLTREEAIAKLTDNYDGYHFATPSPDIFNPYSLMNAFNTGRMKDYWFGTATPTFLINQMKRYGIKPQEIGRQRAWESMFDAPTENMRSITPLLYQSGYLTIKDYNPDNEVYTLDIPNREVRIGLMESLIAYVAKSEAQPALLLVSDMRDALIADDFEKVMTLLKSFLGTIPYTKDTNTEGHYQSLLFVIFSLMSKYVNVEAHTPQGRVDVVLESPNKLYVIELKLNKSADAAIEQIDLRNYNERFVLCGKTIVRVGVNFSKRTRNITSWKIEK